MRAERTCSPSTTSHVVFTVPPAVAAIAYQNKAVVYGLLFRAVAETLRTIAADPRHLGAQIGFFAVLHTWGQTLVHHPHLHCVVPGGGLSPDGTQWVSCRPGFFLPVRVLSRLVRRLLLDAVCEAFETGQLHFAGTLDALNDRQHFAAHLQPARQTGLGGLRQATLRRARPGARLRRSVHASDRHLQPAAPRPRRGAGPVPLHRLPPSPTHRVRRP